MRKNVPGRSEEKAKNNRSSMIVPTVLSILFVGFIILMAICSEKMKPEPEDYFVKYDDATMLVEIHYGEINAFGYQKACGFISQDTYDEYLNDTYDKKTIMVYHPYTKGESLSVNVDSIVAIRESTYEGFYKDHSPSAYIN